MDNWNKVYNFINAKIKLYEEKFDEENDGIMSQFWWGKIKALEEIRELMIALENGDKLADWR